MSIFGVFLIHVFPYSVRMRENMDQKNSEYRHFSRIYFSRLYLFSKILGKIKQRSPSSKVSGYETASYYFWYHLSLETVESNFWELLKYLRELMNSIWCHNVDTVYQTNVMSLLSFGTTLRKGCGNVIMWP